MAKFGPNWRLDLQLLLVLVIFSKGVDVFFIKHSSGLCLTQKTTNYDSGKAWGALYLIELGDKCLEEPSQFRFKENNAIYSEKFSGCLAIYIKFLPYETLFFYKSDNIGVSACKAFRAFKQTSGGSLLNNHIAKNKKSPLSHCVSPYTESMISRVNKGKLLQATLACDQDNQRFTFGSLTCNGNKTKDVNCPTSQVIVINKAFYGGSTTMKTCGYNEVQNCTVDVTCIIKRMCDGLQSCEDVLVNASLLTLQPCHKKDHSMYLYFEYQCFNSTAPEKAMNDNVCSNRLLQNKERFPDSRFTSPSTEAGHEAFKARLSSSGSWCSTCGRGEYLQIDLGNSYVIYSVTTLGDVKIASLVRSYLLNYTLEHDVWQQASSGEKKLISWNIGGFDQTVTRNLDNPIKAWIVRFIPVFSFKNACMQVELCGSTQYPDKPVNFTLQRKTSRDVTVSWIAPVNGGDGGVTGYFISITRVDTMTVKNYTVNNVNPFSPTEKLKPFTAYTISIATMNKHGLSNATELNFTTDEDAPEGPPLNVNVTTLNSSSLLVSWSDPELDKQNGIIQNYTLCFSFSSTSESCLPTYETKLKEMTVNNLNSSTKYYVRVGANTNGGRGIYSEFVDAITNGAPIKPPKNGTVTTLVFNLQLPRPGYNDVIIVAMKLMTENVPNTSPNNYQTDQFVNYSIANASKTPLPYIAARINVSKTPIEMFVLGDSKSSSIRKRRSLAQEYFNGPLQENTHYSIFQRFFDSQNNYYSTDWSEPASTLPVTKPPTEEPATTPTKSTRISTTKSTTKLSGTEEPIGGNKPGGIDSGSTTIIAVVVSVLVIILILVVVAIFIIRRRRGMAGKSAKPERSVAMGELDDVSDAEENATDNIGEDNNSHDFEDGDREGIYSNQSEIDFQKKHDDIPISRLALHIEKMEKDEKFKKEFEELPVGKHFNWNISMKSFNKEKNRYANISTYDHSRVVLSGGEMMDYINASYIDGITEKYYIATQGPKPLTISDFWRMIYEKNCPTIVMVTSLVEIGKRKCEQYWPDDHETYGGIAVTNRETKTFADHVTREFILEKNGNKHEVKQFHFLSWPDHGVPQYPTQLLTFRSHFKAYHQTRTGQVVVHCSAGVGRTGVFIAIDKIIDDIENNNSKAVNIFNVVKQMRTMRTNMVQVLEQYVFIHTALLDYISCGINEVDSTNIGIEINKLSKKSPQGNTGFEKKFKRLSKVSPTFTDVECGAALLPSNRSKNRFATIYPTEMARVYLNHVEGAQGSDYINACFVDGYLGKRFFIAAQVPLTETINDFWRMVYQVKSSTIVMLNQLREDEKEYPMFWPTEKAKAHPYGPMKVMLEEVKKEGKAITRKFNIFPTADPDESHKLRVIQYIAWPDHGVPSDVQDVLTLLSHVEASQRAGKKGPIVVICSDGAGRTGTYITVSNVVDRMKAIQVVDVFQAIKLIRSSRPQFVENAIQFQFCYQVAEAVLKSFDEYSNFRELTG